MRLLTAEVAPAAPVAGELLALAGLIVALGLIKFSDYFCRALFGTATSLVAWIPWLGSKLENGLHAVEQRLTNYLGEAAEKVQTGIGATWHATARTVEWLGRELRHQAQALFSIAAQLPAVATHVLVNPVRDNLLALGKRLRTLEWKFAHTVPKIQKVIIHDVPAKAKAVARSVAIPVDSVLTGDLAALRKRVRALEDRATDLYRKAKGVVTVPMAAAVGAVVAVALTRLGLNWIRCRNWNRVGRQVCRTDPANIEALLGLLVGAIVVADLRDTVKLLQTIEEGSIKAIESILRV